MAFEIWETRSGNLAGSYATRADALRGVQSAVQTHGRAYLQSFALVRADDRGNVTTIAAGEELAELADRARPAANVARTRRRGQPPAVG